MSDIECFWVELTGEVELSLRRYLGERRCTGRYGYCNASVGIGRAPEIRGSNGYVRVLPLEDFEGDDRWPVSCPDCGLSLLDPQVRSQVNQEPIYRAADGREWTSRSLPAGAMFDAVWMHPNQVGPDGISLVVVTPYSGQDARAAMWNVDGSATRTASQQSVPHAWTRTGDPRVPGSVSATPSILTSEYHGFLTNGRLVGV